MPSPSGLSGLLKFAIPVALGGALAGVLAWGGTDRSGEINPPSAAMPTAPALTEKPAASATIQPFVYRNYIRPDLTALAEVAQEQSALASRGQRCPATYVLYESKSLGGSFCHPATWTLVVGDIALLPPAQRTSEYQYYLLVVKKDATGREQARVSIQIIGARPDNLLDCPEKGALRVHLYDARVCFHERSQDPLNLIAPDLARLIAFYRG